MWMDIAIAVGLVALTAIMGYLGVHVTLHPQSDPKQIKRFKYGFALCVGAAISLIAWQTVRSTNQQHENAALLARIERNTEHPPNVNIENKIDTKPLADVFRPDRPAPNPSATPKESPDSLRRRTIKLVNDLIIFWSKRPTPLQQPVQSPTTDDERQRNAKWDQYWRDVTAAYENAGYRERIRGIVSEYKSKGIQTGYLEFADQYNRLVGSAPFGGIGVEDCFRAYTDLCTLRELSYHVDANDKPVILRLDSK